MEKSRVSILYTPASLELDAEPGAEFEHFRTAAAGPTPLGPELIAELRRKGWLSAERWQRGGYLATAGLRQVGHPELAMLNVPGAFAPWARRLLTELGEYVLATGSPLKSGEVFSLVHRDFPELNLTFQRVGGEELTSPPFAQEMVLVLPMP